jgi:hypothetical protein
MINIFMAIDPVELQHLKSKLSRIIFFQATCPVPVPYFFWIGSHGAPILWFYQSTLNGSSVGTSARGWFSGGVLSKNCCGVVMLPWGRGRARGVDLRRLSGN